MWHCVQHMSGCQGVCGSTNAVPSVTPCCCSLVVGSWLMGVPTRRICSALLVRGQVKACHSHVALPSINYASFNVAVAGSIVMYDRVLKQVWGGPKSKRDKGASTPSPWRRCGSVPLFCAYVLTCAYLHNICVRAHALVLC